MLAYSTRIQRITTVLGAEKFESLLRRLCHNPFNIFQTGPAGTKPQRLASSTKGDEMELYITFRAAADELIYVEQPATVENARVAPLKSE